jgi:predicted ribosome quality control (RQC) complex YloA/Tae2 family protein
MEATALSRVLLRAEEETAHQGHRSEPERLTKRGNTVLNPKDILKIRPADYTSSDLHAIKRKLMLPALIKATAAIENKIGQIDQELVSRAERANTKPPILVDHGPCRQYTKEECAELEKQLNLPPRTPAPHLLRSRPQARRQAEKGATQIEPHPYAFLRFTPTPSRQSSARQTLAGLERAPGHRPIARLGLLRGGGRSSGYIRDCCRAGTRDPG